MIKKIVSGGQTGADRAALDVAIKLKIEHGGWCPKGRKAEDGRLDSRYALIETLSDGYEERTKKNALDSDGTLILVTSMPVEENSGTFSTIMILKCENKPYMILELNSEIQNNAILSWIKENHINVLNIAGPKESKCKGIYSQCFSFLEKLFTTNLDIKDDL